MCNLEQDLGKEKGALEIWGCFARLVALLGACSCGEHALGKGAKPSRYQKKQISPRNWGWEVSVPQAMALMAAGLAPSCVVLAPCWTQPLLSLSSSSSLPNLPTDVGFFSEPRAQKGWFMLSNRTLLLGVSGAGGLGRSQVNPHPPQDPKWEGSPHHQDLESPGFKIQPGIYLQQCR